MISDRLYIAFFSALGQIRCDSHVLVHAGLSECFCDPPNSDVDYRISKRVRGVFLHAYTYWGRVCVWLFTVSSEGVKSCLYRIQTQKGSNERLFILTQTHSMQIFGEIPFIKPQKDTETTDKRSKTMKNERKRLLLFGLIFTACSCFRTLAIILFQIIFLFFYFFVSVQIFFDFFFKLEIR